MGLLFNPIRRRRLFQFGVMLQGTEELLRYIAYGGDALKAPQNANVEWCSIDAAGEWDCEMEIT